MVRKNKSLGKSSAAPLQVEPLEDRIALTLPFTLGTFGVEIFTQAFNEVEIDSHDTGEPVHPDIAGVGLTSDHRESSVTGAGAIGDARLVDSDGNGPKDWLLSASTHSVGGSSGCPPATPN